MDLNLKKIKKVLEHRYYKLIGRTYYGKRNKKIVFVLSSGRCGSKSIVKMFNQHPKFIAFHEEIPELIKLSTDLAEKPESKKIVYKQLDTIFRNKIWYGNSDSIHVHSDHRMWNLVEFLSGYFPNAIFIHLLRNPYDSIKSMVPRNWYTQDFDEGDNSNIFEKYRLRGNRLGLFSDKEWQSFSNPEKCAWYWNFVNVSIANQLKELDTQKHPSLTVNLEYLTVLMNSRIREIFGLRDSFFFKNIVSNQTSEDKVISDNSRDIEKATKRFATAREIFYPR